MNVYTGKSVFHAGSHATGTVLMKFVRLLVQAMIGLTALGVHAQGGRDMTEEEYALLPEYCRYKAWVSNTHPNPPKSEKWENFFGRDFVHIHHYCWGLVWLGRANRSGVSEQDRKTLLIMAHGGANYVLENTGPNFPIRAELYTRQLEISLLQRNENAAEHAFRKAVEANPKFVRAYWLRAYWLFKRGKLPEAMKVAEQGLEQVPESKMLNELVAEMRAARKSQGK
ncbi:MAG: hypothetical protein Q8O34_03135 [Rhodocyclaceae bacterium]|nr:hypothetical protein [Rhodocyclaceae bacterium]